jgi:phosphopantetheine--protein transferase-like protein
MLGIDIVDIAQIKTIYQKHGLLFLERILDDAELNDLPAAENDNFFKKLSCYIASKEAIFKACSEGGLDWKDISIRGIAKDPSVRIKNANFKKKIKLTFCINRDIVLSQALIT